jgi:3-methylcrotonyl-CoA carboxylase alpha subunit
MFKKVLIANRGEIACRIIKTLNKMGIQSVAIYSSADKFHPFVKMADEAYWVGGPLPTESYLNIDKIIEIAKRSEACAIHPGYGFLSENPLFAKACANAGIVFIGPNIEAMENVGSKQRAKALLANTNVPLVPGFNPPNPSDAELLNAAKNIGFPLVIKAAHGGGGKGLKRVNHLDEFSSMLAAARREAKNYFGNDEVILEKFIANPRHLEVQILGDKHANIIHLFERDCSVQRRQQKIIEEAPAAFLSQDLKQKLYQAALTVAKTFNYDNAGTVEFLLENDGELYFMEVNARLQVEHPVTEMITGLDLVEWQIRIAQGEPLNIRQPDSPKGHAIECRICAEDPAEDFRPSQGVISTLIWPNIDKHTRIDTGIHVHQKIEGFYDSLLAKTITWGQDRATAIHTMFNLLKQVRLQGITTNINYLQAILADDTWQMSPVNIHFLAGFKIKSKTIDEHHFVIAAQIIYLSQRQQHHSLDSSLADFSIGPKRFSPMTWQMGEHIFTILSHCTSSSSYLIQINGLTYSIEYVINGHELYLAIEDQSYHFSFKKTGHHFEIKHGLSSGQVYAVSSTALLHHQDDIAPKITSPMPANIVAFYKKVGDSIEKGEAILVLEAMKMEHTIYAPANGVVREIHYQAGQQVQEGKEILVIEYQ